MKSKKSKPSKYEEKFKVDMTFEEAMKIIAKDADKPKDKKEPKQSTADK
jgi:hypothetical protein